MNSVPPEVTAPELHIRYIIAWTSPVVAPARHWGLMFFTIFNWLYIGKKAHILYNYAPGVFTLEIRWGFLVYNTYYAYENHMHSVCSIIIPSEVHHYVWKRTCKLRVNWKQVCSKFARTVYYIRSFHTWNAMRLPCIQHILCIWISYAFSMR